MVEKSIKDRGIEALEARVSALTYVLGAFLVIALFNLGAALWFFQDAQASDLQFIPIVLTIFEIFIAVAIIGGFWMLRSAARERAAEAAREIAIEVAEPAARRAAMGYIQYMKETSGQDDDTLLNEMMQALAKEDEK